MIGWGNIEITSGEKRKCWVIRHSANFSARDFIGYSQETGKGASLYSVDMGVKTANRQGSPTDNELRARRKHKKHQI